MIRREPTKDVEIQVLAQVSAKHLRDALLYGRGCDNVALTRMDPDADYDHWHTGPGDNAWLTTARFLVESTREDGAYTFGINAYGRPFNPAGGDNGPSSSRRWCRRT